MKFIALPVEVDHVQWTGNLADLPAAWRLAESFRVEEETGDLIVPTKQGPSHAHVGEWIGIDPEGLPYPMSRKSHAAKYRAATPFTRLVARLALRLLGGDQP